jgi:lipoate-protein ligase A
MMDCNEQELTRVLNDPNIIKDSCKIGTIKKYAPSVDIGKLKDAIRVAFERFFKVKFILEPPTEFESNLALQLVREKYSTDEWNLSR